MMLVSQGALIVYAAILNQKLATSLQKKSQKRKKRPKHLDEVKYYLWTTLRETLRGQMFNFSNLSVIYHCTGERRFELDLNFVCRNVRNVRDGKR